MGETVDVVWLVLLRRLLRSVEIVVAARLWLMVGGGFGSGCGRVCFMPFEILAFGWIWEKKKPTLSFQDRQPHVRSWWCVSGNG